MTDAFAPNKQDPIKTIKEVVQVLPLVFRFLWQVSPTFLILTCSLMGVTALIPAAIVYMTKVLIDGVVEISGQGGSWTDLTLPLVGLFALWLSRSIFESISGFIQEILGERTYFEAQRLIIEKAGQLDLAFFENPRFYDQLHHANENYYQMGNVCWSSLSLVAQAFSLTAMVSLLSVLHPLAIVLLLLTVFPRLFTVGYLARKRYQMHSNLVRNDRMIFYLRRLMTTRESSKEVRSFNLKTHLIDRFNEFKRIYIDAIRQLIFLSLKVNLGLDVLSLGGLIFIWAFAVYQAVQGDITIGELAMVFQAAQQSQSMLAGIISSGGGVYQNALFVTRFFEFLDLDPKSVEGSLKPRLSAGVPVAVPSPIHEGLVFENVSFKYPANEEWVLRDVSFKIEKGSTVALAGQNGAGKTTIVKLLSRLYDPVEGRILLDGVDLRDYSIPDLRNQISIVFQDFFKYDFTAGENIGLGRVDSIQERSLIETAAKQGGAHDVIENLPKQYETILGKTFDEGIDLSGGEWQHLAISRAFMSNAQVLILDEPTAALDAFREHELYEQVSAMAKQKTVIFISHRFSTVRMANDIIVIEHGKLIEQGDHESLLKCNGHYAAMFNTQASRYR